MQVIARELPLEGLGQAREPLLKSEDRSVELLERFEVVRREHLSLQDGEVDLDLVEPTRVYGCVDQDQIRPLLSKPFAGRRSTMG